MREVPGIVTVQCPVRWEVIVDFDRTDRKQTEGEVSMILLMFGGVMSDPR